MHLFLVTLILFVSYRLSVLHWRPTLYSSSASDSVFRDFQPLVRLVCHTALRFGLGFFRQIAAVKVTISDLYASI